MVVYPQDISIGPLNVSDKLQEEYSNGKKFPADKLLTITCKAQVAFQLPRKNNHVRTFIVWEYVLKDLIHYRATCEYYIDYSDLTNIKEELDKMIIHSIGQMFNEFKNIYPSIDLDASTPDSERESLTQKVLDLRSQIALQLRQGGGTN